MNADQILMEIRETNLSYLMLAQSLIRADREQALFRLGISEDTATTLAWINAVVGCLLVVEYGFLEPLKREVERWREAPR